MNQFAQPQSWQVSHFAGEKRCQSFLQPCANLFCGEFLIHVSPPVGHLVNRRGSPHIPRFDPDCISKCDPIMWKVFFNPSESVGREGVK